MKQKQKLKLLDRIEQFIEHLMEASVGRVFRSPVQPAEIGRKLERAMMANLAASVDHPIAPNDFHVRMHPDDLVNVADYATSLTRQFETWLTDMAAARDYSIIDRIRVQLHADDSVRRREIRVTAAIADRPDHGRDQQEAVQRTEIYRVIHDTAGVSAILLQGIDGVQGQLEFVVRHPLTTIGRALDNTIVLDSTDVSRHHARLELSGNQARIIDLDSTNGTRVNGARVQERPLRAGDEIMFGALKFLVRPYGAPTGQD